MNGGIVRNRSQADKISDKRYVHKNGLSRRSDQAFLKGAMVRILKWKGLPSKALSNPIMFVMFCIKKRNEKRVVW